MSATLLDRTALEALAGEPDLPSLVAALGARVPVDTVRVDEVELALRRVNARRWERIGRWCGDRARFLAPLFLDEDRRSLVAILRAVAAGGHPDRALAGLVPTPGLPEKVLQTLARQPSPRAIASQLLAVRHPFGAPLHARSGAGLGAMEHNLHEAWARLSARTAGDAVLRGHVRESIDGENVASALVAARQPPATRDPAVWLPGGARLDARAYADALEAPRLDDSVQRLRRAVAGTPFAVALGRPQRGRFELDALSERIRRSARALREQPLGTAAIVRFALRTRAEAIDLRALIWALALGRSASRVDELLVTP